MGGRGAGAAPGCGGGGPLLVPEATVLVGVGAAVPGRAGGYGAGSVVVAEIVFGVALYIVSEVMPPPIVGLIGSPV